MQGLVWLHTLHNYFPFYTRNSCKFSNFTTFATQKHCIRLGLHSTTSHFSACFIFIIAFLFGSYRTLIHINIHFCQNKKKIVSKGDTPDLLMITRRILHTHDTWVRGETHKKYLLGFNSCVFNCEDLPSCLCYLDCICKIEWKTGEIAVVFVNGKNKRLLNTFKM